MALSDFLFQPSSPRPPSQSPQLGWSPPPSFVTLPAGRIAVPLNFPHASSFASGVPLSGVFHGLGFSFSLSWNEPWGSCRSGRAPLSPPTRAWISPFPPRRSTTFSFSFSGPPPDAAPFRWPRRPAGPLARIVFPGTGRRLVWAFQAGAGLS